jgi:hypothetical protein
VRRFSVDEARLRPHLRDRGQLERRQGDVLREEFERASQAGIDTTAPRWKTPVGDDFERLRGLPAVAPGVRGVQPGTDPVQALLRKESNREKRG